jgi:protoporphyrinogen oxidase
MDLLKFSPLSLPNRIRAGLAVFYLQRTNNWKQFEHITAYQWMLKNAGKQVTEVIWEPLLKGKFDKYYDKVSMAWLWARIHIRANSREAGDKSEKLGYFNGGFQTFTNALVAALKKNEVVIKTGANISNIDSLDSGEVKINFDDGKSQTFDSCLATTPSHVFAKLIGHNKNIKKEYIDQLNGTNYLGALLYIFSSDQEISPYYWHNINDTDLSFLVFINHTRLIDKKNYKNHYVYYIGAYLDMDHRLFKASEEDIEKEWHTGLKQIFPDFDASKIREKHIFKLGNAQHIVDTDYASHIPSYKSPLSNIYLANFAQIYPEDRGTNYAVREGEKVADIMMSAR